jgi:hypothetical protein
MVGAGGFGLDACQHHARIWVFYKAGHAGNSLSHTYTITNIRTHAHLFSTTLVVLNLRCNGLDIEDRITNQKHHAALVCFQGFAPQVVRLLNPVLLQVRT